MRFFPFYGRLDVHKRIWQRWLCRKCYVQLAFFPFECTYSIYLLYFVALFTVFLFFPRVCYKMLAAGSVRFGFSAIGIPETPLRLFRDFSCRVRIWTQFVYVVWVGFYFFFFFGRVLHEYCIYKISTLYFSTFVYSFPAYLSQLLTVYTPSSQFCSSSDTRISFYENQIICADPA